MARCVVGGAQERRAHPVVVLARQAADAPRSTSPRRRSPIRSASTTATSRSTAWPTFVLHVGRAGAGPAAPARCTSAGYATGHPTTRRLPPHWPLDDIMDAGVRDRPSACGSRPASGPTTSTCPRCTTASRRSCGSGSRRSGSVPVGEAHAFVADGGIDSDAPGGDPGAVGRWRARATGACTGSRRCSSATCSSRAAPATGSG